MSGIECLGPVVELLSKCLCVCLWVSVFVCMLVCLCATTAIYLHGARVRNTSIEAALTLLAVSIRTEKQNNQKSEIDDLRARLDSMSAGGGSNFAQLNANAAAGEWPKFGCEDICKTAHCSTW